MKSIDLPKIKYTLDLGTEIEMTNENGAVVEMLKFKDYLPKGKAKSADDVVTLSIYSGTYKDQGVQVYLDGKDTINKQNMFVVPAFGDCLKFTITNNKSSVELIRAGGGGGGELEPWQTDLLNQLKPLGKDGTLYYNRNAMRNPKLGDRRDINKGIGRNTLQEYNGTEWVDKIGVGCVVTDAVTLKNGLNDIKVVDKQYTYNLVRNLKTMNGIQVGSSFKPLALTANNGAGARLYYPEGKTQELVLNPIGEEELLLPRYFEYVHEKENMILKGIMVKAVQSTKLRVRFINATDGENAEVLFEQYLTPGGTDDKLLFESVPETEYYNVESERYGGEIINGETVLDIKSEMYLTNGSRYVIIFDTIMPDGGEHHFLGSNNNIFCKLVAVPESSSEVVTLETFRRQDFVIGPNMWFLTRANIDGSDTEVNTAGVYEGEGEFGLLTKLGTQEFGTSIQSKDLPKVNYTFRPDPNNPNLWDRKEETMATQEWVKSQGGSINFLDYARKKENIICNVRRDVQPTNLVSQGFIFSKHPEFIQTTSVIAEMQFPGFYDIEISSNGTPAVHATLKSITVNGKTLIVGGNKQIRLNRGENEIVIEVEGTSWSLDGGDTWKSGTYPSLNIDITSDGVVEIPLLEGEGWINRYLIR